MRSAAQAETMPAVALRRCPIRRTTGQEPKLAAALQSDIALFLLERKRGIARRCVPHGICCADLLIPHGSGATAIHK
eukprot:4159398-Pleurochrysis_carterae.AAC.1